MRTVLLYALFAALATAVNLLTQILSIWSYSGLLSIPVSVLMGTIAGIVVKYLLDKKYIFRVSYSTADQHIRSASFYLLASILTTLVFWGTEAAFHFAFDSAGMRYLGGALGLAAGYVMKYNLDRRFAFG